MWATGIRLNWVRPAAILGCAAASVAAVSLTPLDGSFGGGVAAGAIFTTLIAIGAIGDRRGRLEVVAAVASPGAA
jgi:hypothetical protein